MNLEHLHAFVVAAKAGNISAAGRTLGKSQSTTSNAIASLEIDLGVELFDRTGHKAKLSAAGQELLSYAEVMLKVADNFTHKASSLAKGEEGKITLAVDDSLPWTGLNAMLADLMTVFPDLNLDFLHPSPSDALRLVETEHADAGIAISQEPSPKVFFARTVGHVQFVPIAKREHPLAHLALVTNDDLAQYRQIHTVGRSGVQTPFPNVYAQPLWRVERHSDAVEMVEAGFGWSIVPSHLAKPGLTTGDLSELNHEYHRGAFLVPIDLIWPKRLRPGPAVRWVIDNAARFL